MFLLQWRFFLKNPLDGCGFIFLSTKHGQRIRLVAGQTCVSGFLDLAPSFL